ncbi:MAG: hypothetical protein MJ238_05185, partial [Bacilli bacterium]|nr:hypothetical protein [Bacilli bacterium]
QKNYAVFTKKADNKNGYIYLNMRLESTGLIVDSWIVVEEAPAIITDWRDETKAALKDLTMEDDYLPVAPLSEGYIQEVYEYNEFSDIIDIFDPRPVSDFAEQYMPLLIEAGFVENEFYFEKTGYHVFEKPSVIMEAFNICVKFGKGPLGLGFQVYKQEKLGGFGFVEYFPTEYIKNFLDHNESRYTKFPEFPSELDGEYMFGTEDYAPIFTIEIYQPRVMDTLLDVRYKEMLEADGWVVDGSNYADEKGNVLYGYVARKPKVDFYLRFFSLDEVFVFHLYPNSYDYRENC